LRPVFSSPSFWQSQSVALTARPFRFFFQVPTAAGTSSCVPLSNGASPAGAATYSTASSSGRGSGSGGSGGSHYHQSLPRHFLRGGTALPQGCAAPPSAALGQGSSSKARPQTRGLSYSASQYQQAPPRAPPPQHPIRTVSYYSTLGAANGHGPSRDLPGLGGVYPDAPRDATQPPRQFDAYYYHPATLNHSQTSVPLYSGAYARPRPNGEVVPLPDPAHRFQTSKKPSPSTPSPSGPAYSDLTSLGVPQYPSSSSSYVHHGGRPRPLSSSASASASTEYAVLQFIPHNVGKEIDV